jgi:hypothetical protein
LPVLAFLAYPAAADSTSVGVSVTTDRDAHDLSDPNDTKVEISAAHSFDNGVILGASTEYSNTAFSDKASVLFEGTVGYRAQLGNLFFVTGSAGLGEHIRASGSGNNFPYYVFRIATDVKVDDDVTWNVLSFRYRNAFDPDDDFLTPQMATGISYDLNEHSSISAAVQYNWKDRKPDTVGLDIGLKYRF